MAAGKYSFIIEQGTTLNMEIVWKDSDDVPIDLSGYTARMQLRPSAASSEVYLALTSTLRADGTGLNLSGSSGDTPLASGSIGIFISAVSSSLLTFDEALYDLELESDNSIVTRLIEGKIKLSKEITR